MLPLAQIPILENPGDTAALIRDTGFFGVSAWLLVERFILTRQQREDIEDDKRTLTDRELIAREREDRLIKVIQANAEAMEKLSSLVRAQAEAFQDMRLEVRFAARDARTRHEIEDELEHARHRPKDDPREPGRR